MQSRIFVRPNLKGFVVGGILVLGFHCVLQQIEGITTAPPCCPSVPLLVTDWTDAHYKAMLHHAVDRPTADAFYKLSSYLEHKRDPKKALTFLRKAEALARAEEESE